jgi:hypothetical protein
MTLSMHLRMFVPLRGNVVAHSIGVIKLQVVVGFCRRGGRGQH